MIHLLDANVLIDANRDYYPIDRVPQFWQWLRAQALAGSVAIPLEIYEEVSEGNDAVASWLRDEDIKGAILLQEEANLDLVRRVLVEGYGPDLNDDEIERVGRDPFLIAVARKERANRRVVTNEGSRPSRRGANRHLPDVCNTLGVAHCHAFQMLRDLDFRVR